MMKLTGSLWLRTVVPLLAAVPLLISCNSQNETGYYSGSVEFPVSPVYGMKEAMAAHVVPHPRQYAWQQNEMTAFIHFGINTFTDREWGTGKESPAHFNPSGLDADQWVKSLGDAGMKMVILTAKHHDGFCLWPTETTSHSVASSPWKEGRGDVVRELKEACVRYNMKFGLYLSPWDRNAKCYGESEEYNRFYIRQLTELLTWYGKVDEVWFDGACGEGPGGKKQVYDWNAYYTVVRDLQPEAVIAVMGEDVRWVGTESGYGRETEWSVTALAPGGSEESAVINKRLGLNPSSEDLGSSAILQKADRVFWYPAEVDVSIRPGWFWHAGEDTLVKTTGDLADIYFSSVGRNAVLLLNVPPDDRGLLHDNDLRSLGNLRQYLDATFRSDLLSGARPYSQGAANAIDGDNTTSWTPSDKAVASFVPAISVTFNVALLREDITRGQRVEYFVIETRNGDRWDTIARATTIGYKRLLRFPTTTADEIRLSILSSRTTPNISTFALYLSADSLLQGK